MNLYSIKVFDEMVLDNLENELSKHGVKYFSRRISDSSFPSLNNSNAIVELTFETKNDLALDVILSKKEYKDFIQVSRSETRKPKKGIRLNTVLILYSILMTGLFIRYWHLDYINNTDKIFNYSWNYNNTRLDAINKRNDLVVTTHFDKNYDLNYELVYSYYEGKGPIMISYDNDENGYFEKIEQYNLDGKLYGFYMDGNNDHWFEYSYLVTEEGDTIFMDDQDKDGFVEIKKVIATSDRK